MAEQETERKLSRREQRRTDEGEPSSSGGDRAQIPSGNVTSEPTNRRERRAAASGKNREGRGKDRSQPAVRSLDASELVDDALARGTDKTAKWLKQNFNILQWILVGGIAVWVGYQIYNWRSGKGHGQASGILMKGVSASLAKLEGSADPAEEPAASVPPSPDPTYKTNEERLKAARDAFDQTIAARPTDGTAVLAQLGLGSLALDEGKYADARNVYTQVKGSKLAASSDEVRGRALEGIALSFEGDGNTDAALKAYQELENTEIAGFKESAMLSEARLHFDKGEISQAKDLVTKLKERLSKDKDKEQQTAESIYLQPALSALALAIDPNSQPAPLGAGAGSTSPEDLEKLQKTLEELSKKAGKHPAGDTAPTEAPAGSPKAP